MKAFLFCLMFPLAVFSYTIEQYLLEYPKNYQDVVVNGKTIALGSQICEERYNLIKPILSSLNYPFKVLDIGAAQAFFDFKILHDFPESKCVMIEGAHYKTFIDRIKKICDLNDNKNVQLIPKLITIEDLKSLSKEHHFDIAFTFLVLHQMYRSLDDRIQVLEILKSMATKIIIELPLELDKELLDYMDGLVKKNLCICFGELPRNRHEKSPIGRFYLMDGNKD